MTIQEIRLILVMITFLIITFLVFYKITLKSVNGSVNRKEKINEQKAIDFMKKVEKFKF